jgi:hypothetical protein
VVLKYALLQHFYDLLPVLHKDVKTTYLTGRTAWLLTGYAIVLSRAEALKQILNH